MNVKPAELTLDLDVVTVAQEPWDREDANPCSVRADTG
jgi:hypothetical protein